MTAITLFVALAIPVRFAGQDQQEQNMRHHYFVFNLGTLGGTSSAGNTINDLGWAMGIANLSGNTAGHATLWAYGAKLDLGTLGGLNSAVDWPVKNDRGEIAGIAETSTIDPLGENWSCSAFFPTAPTHHICLGFVWHFGLMTPLSGVEGNNSGSASVKSQSPGMMIPLPTLGGNNGYASGVNNLGQVVGWAENTVHDPTCVSPQVLQFEAVIYGPEKDQIRELQPLPGDPDGAATAINDKGQVVGISGICQNAVGELSAEHALLWQNEPPTDLGNLGGAGWNTPTGINNHGQIVGFSDLPGDDKGQNPNFHAFLWTKEGGIQDLGTLPGDTISEATGINDQGQVVGVSCVDISFSNCRAFLWQNDVMTDLNTLIPPGSPLYLISTGDINDYGEITGQACVLSNGACSSETPAFLAIPRHDGDSSEAASSAEPVGGNPVPKVILPENVRQTLLRRLGLGYPGAGPVKPQ